MFSVNTDKGFVITILDEVLNINNTESLRNDLKKAIAANPNMDVVIDLAHVKLLDSSGIAMFVNFVQSLSGSQKKLSLINVAPAVKNTIKVLNLSKYLNVK
jgi:anti-anti-sigma factor